MAASRDELASKLADVVDQIAELRARIAAAQMRDYADAEIRVLTEELGKAKQRFARLLVEVCGTADPA